MAKWSDRLSIVRDRSRGQRAPARQTNTRSRVGASNGDKASMTPAAIVLKGVTKAYQTDTGPFWALKGIDLEVYPGEFIAVVGKSGSGKSTLINVFTGIDHPTDGEVIVAQTQIRGLNEGQMAEWRGRHMGIVFQFFQLLPTLTIVENVMLPMDLCDVYEPGERHARAMHLLEQMELADLADMFPASVSGGDQQRAAIARALANDPPILVADEPTGNLDSKTAEAVFELFESLVAGGKTILMVTHDDELADRVPRVLTLADGLMVSEKLHPSAVAAQKLLGWVPAQAAGAHDAGAQGADAQAAISAVQLVPSVP
jgi:putative ABC transport system ATP-binding protein